jgi:hypothetical protein
MSVKWRFPLRSELADTDFKPRKPDERSNA